MLSPICLASPMCLGKSHRVNLEPAISEPPVWVHQKGVTPICSDFPNFFRFLPICVPCFLEYPDLFRFVPIAPISSDLFSEQIRTNQGNTLLPTPFAIPRQSCCSAAAPPPPRQRQSSLSESLSPWFPGQGGAKIPQISQCACASNPQHMSRSNYGFKRCKSCIGMTDISGLTLRENLHARAMNKQLPGQDKPQS